MLSQRFADRNVLEEEASANLALLQKPCDVVASQSRIGSDGDGKPKPGRFGLRGGIRKDEIVLQVGQAIPEKLPVGPAGGDEGAPQEGADEDRTNHGQETAEVKA